MNGAGTRELSTEVLKTRSPPSAGAVPTSRVAVTAPPTQSAVLAGVCAIAVVTAWSCHGTQFALPAFAVAYLAGMAIPIVGAAVELARGRLTIDLLMILAAAGSLAQ